MNKILKKWEIIGFIFVVALGSLGHFLYEWTGQNALVGKFFAANESTWEHLKLLFFPYVIFMIIQWFCIGKNYKGFALAKLIGVLSGMAMIVIIFYTYTGVIGTSNDFFNIVIFVVSSAFAFYVSFRLLSGGGMKATLKTFSLITFLLVGILFVTFTANPPQINLFKDPVTGNYGTQNISDAAGYENYEMKLF
ncbi:MAG: hypothetical protein IJE46_01300 [Clostridia bacterium]|nr:hypothetical protein [Clostridia bacterium]